MTTQESTTEKPEPDDATRASCGAGDAPSENVEVQQADFAPVQDENSSGAAGAPITRFHDVQVSITAELGKAQISIRKLLQLGSGSVIELDRSISSPVEIIAHGVPLACGEVVVVNDCFAIRISEIYPSPPAAGGKS